jgi:predicted dehydrogenase
MNNNARQTMRNIAFEKHPLVRVGYISCGGRAGGHVSDVLAIDGTQITALCDLSEAHLERAKTKITEKGQPEPTCYHGPEAWREMLDQPDIDLVYISTPWDLHVPQAIAAMEAGKHCAVEVPVAFTLDECWQLIYTSEKTRKHCIILENCCYGYEEMLLKSMAHGGLLGTLTHAECAYIHDLRSLLLTDSSEGLWRRFPHVTRNGNLYPTHGLGPIAQSLKIGSDDQFDFLVSVSSREASLTEYRDANMPNDSPKRAENYQCGDMNVSIIKTKLGRSIVLQHDVVTPRPYDRICLLAGTKGTFRDYPPRLFLDGRDSHDWLSADDYAELKTQWEDPLWTNMGELAKNRGGHGGMDFLMNYQLITAMQNGLAPEMDVYDATLWSAPGPLSEESVKNGSAPIKFPDFLGGESKA